MAKEKDVTHIQVKTESKNALIEMRDQGGLASIAVVIEKMIKYCHGKKL